MAGGGGGNEWIGYAMVGVPVGLWILAGILRLIQYMMDLEP